MKTDIRTLLIVGFFAFVVGAVIFSPASSDSISVLNDLDDVDASSPPDKYGLTYSTANQTWYPSSSITIDWLFIDNQPAGFADGVDNIGTLANQPLNTTDSPHFDSITISQFILGTFGGGIDISGNPWSLSGTDFNIVENLTVNQNISAFMISGDGSQLTGIVVDWENITGIPAGFADNVDNTSAGGDTPEYMVPIWAEENAGLATNSYEWAFGNGANTPSDGGLTVYVPSGWNCSAISMSIRVGGGTANVTLLINGAEQLGAGCVDITSGQSATNEFPSPLYIEDNDYVNFRTKTASGTSGPCVVTVWLRYVKE